MKQRYLLKMRASCKSREVVIGNYCQSYLASGSAVFFLWLLCVWKKEVCARDANVSLSLDLWEAGSYRVVLIMRWFSKPDILRRGW